MSAESVFKKAAECEGENHNNYSLTLETSPQILENRLCELKIIRRISIIQITAKVNPLESQEI